MSEAATAPANTDRDDRRAVRVWNLVHKLRAQYEAALPRDDLWQLADFKDADAALRPEIRRQIRSRARYEDENNPLVTRVLDVWTNDVTGPIGPALWMNTGSKAVDAFLETKWETWWKVSNQAGKLNTAVRADAVDGETLGVLISNPRLLRFGSASLDVVSLECDRLASPRFENSNRENYVDGVHINPLTREPWAYDILKAHPGTEYVDAYHKVFEATTYPEDAVLHAFRKKRSEQHRGNCRYAPVLPISGLHRKSLEANVNRAQLHAAFMFLLKSIASGEDEGDTNEDSWFDTITLPNRSGIGGVLPEGYDPVQLKVEGAPQDLEVFHRIIAALVGGCFSMPVGLALGQYTTASYPGTRAEMQPYHDAIAVARSQTWEPMWLYPLFAAFIREQLLTTEFRQLIDKLGVRVRAKLNLYAASFVWPGQQLIVDPSREETAKKNRMATGQTNREIENPGVDFDKQDQRSAELAGMSLEEYRKMVAYSTHGVPTPGSGDEPRNSEPGSGANSEKNSEIDDGPPSRNSADDEDEES